MNDFSYFFAVMLFEKTQIMKKSPGMAQVKKMFQNLFNKKFREK